LHVLLDLFLVFLDVLLERIYAGLVQLLALLMLQTQHVGFHGLYVRFQHSASTNDFFIGHMLEFEGRSYLLLRRGERKIRQSVGNLQLPFSQAWLASP